ncbi:MAG: phage tail protein, partial [Microbacterium sp.]|nr:phage tail protein [Microbacterium sp.]
AAGSGRLCAPGEALARATCAWADEMLCDPEVETHVTLLGGFLGTADIVEHLTDSLGMDAATISAPESYGLLTR